MNRKVLLIFVALFAEAILATPIIGTAMAGKGQEKLYFKLYMEGAPIPPPERSWTSDDVTHARGMPWKLLGNAYVWIGEGGSVEMITKPYLSYSGSLDANRNLKTNQATIVVTEIISVWADTTHTTLRGTIEIMSVDKLDYGPPVLGAGAFVGHGTGEFEGVKVDGASSSYVATLLVAIREGTVMGWPT